MNVKKYVELIRTFVDGELPASEFEREYLSVFKSDSGAMPDQLYDILQDLFTAVDCYWPECQPDQETTFEISEESLRREAYSALKRLIAYLDLGSN